MTFSKHVLPETNATNHWSSIPKYGTNSELNMNKQLTKWYIYQRTLLGRENQVNSRPMFFLATETQ